jgi:prolyl-tRNA editing enzyme YbaK/EbsC (Cys-tRNA(Pro) deacylase)
MTDSPSELTHPGIDNVVSLLRAAGWDGEVHTFSDGVKTARAAAAGLGCEVGAIANSLIFDAAGSPVLILTSGAHRVDPEPTARTIGVDSLDRATPDFVRTHTGQTIGGVAPLGHPEPVPTYLDKALAAYPVIWAAAGHSHAVFSTTYDELRELTDAVEIDVD